MKTDFTVRNVNDMDAVMKSIRTALSEQIPHTVLIYPDTESEQHLKRRTLSQNASLHKYCQTIAQKMNDAGYTQRKLVGSFKKGFELPVSEYMVKDIFREVGLAMYQKDSTAKLETTEMSEVYKIVDERFGQVTGVRAEWPSRFSHG